MEHDNEKINNSCGETYSKIKYKINNGLQQGTVNLPILFNIYISEMLKLFNLNKHN